MRATDPLQDLLYFVRDPWPWGQPHEAAGIHRTSRQRRSGLAACGASVRGTKKEARAELRKRLERPTTAGKISVGQWLALWLETMRQEVSPKTHERYSELVQNFLVPKLGAVPLVKLGPLHIQP